MRICLIWWRPSFVYNEVCYGCLEEEVLGTLWFCHGWWVGVWSSRADFESL